MNDIQEGVITLIKSAVTGESFPLPESFSINEAFDFILKHKVMMLAYEGAIKCGISKKEPAMQKLFLLYVRGLLHSEKQMKAINELYASFEEKKIDYLPLKGCVIKKLYPKPELRAMGDADILIKDEQYGAIETILLEKGYEQKSSYHQHYEWESENLYVEMHRMLMPEDYKVLHEYYGNGWSRAIKLDGYRYGYSKEDEFVFAVAHFAKHYLCGGIGLRHVTDLYVFTKTYPEMDFEYIENETEKLGLQKFYKNICLLIENWFEGKKVDVEKTVEDFILESGNWGGYEAHVLAKSARNNKGGEIGGEKIKYMLQTAFPGIDGLDKKYRWVEKVPFLLPVAWVQRGFDILLFRRERISGKLKYIETVEDEKVKIYSEKLKKSGFDI